MLGLPAKPWRKVRIELQADGHYSITFVSPMKSEVEFRKIIKEDLTVCIGEDCLILHSDWESKTLSLKTKDVEGFQKKLVSRMIAVETT